jgi:hypothetical protein
LQPLVGMTRGVHGADSSSDPALGRQNRSKKGIHMISDIKIPDSKIAREAAELLRQHESEMLFNHSVRVLYSER